MNKIFFAFLMLVLATRVFAGAGDTKGNGGGTLARLLSYAKSEISNTVPLLQPQVVDFKSPKIASWYAKYHKKISTDVRNIKLVATTEGLRDSYFGYETWIRLKNDADFIVEYNPDIQNFQALVGIVNVRYRGNSDKNEVTPTISDVTEYLLHEVGHYYGLDEHDAWNFAQVLLKHFIFAQPIQPKTCEFSVENIKSLANVFSTSFILDPSNTRHVFKVNGLKYIFALNREGFEFVVDIVNEIPVSVYSLVLPANTPLPGSAVLLNENEQMALKCD